MGIMLMLRTGLEIIRYARSLVLMNWPSKTFGSCEIWWSLTSIRRQQSPLVEIYGKNGKHLINTRMTVAMHFSTEWRESLTLQLQVSGAEPNRSILATECGLFSQ